jgi:hypothetical protein
VTEYVRRGTSTDPNAEMPKEKQIHALKAPKQDEYDHDKVVLIQ